MTENLKGEVRFTALGKDWKMHMTVNGLCALEEAVGVGFQDFLAGFGKSTETGKMRIGDIRRLFWAGLQEHHEDVDLQTAGRMITDLGGIEPAQELLAAAVAAAFPQQEKAGEDGVAHGNPPPA